MLALLEKGKVDGGMPLFLTPERQKYALYTDVPLHEASMTVFTSMESKLEYKSLSSLYGLTIGIRRGYSVSHEFDKAVEGGLIKTTEVDDVFQLIKIAEFGRVDAIVDKYLTTNYYGKESGIKLKIVGEIAAPRDAFLVVSKNAKGIINVNLLILLNIVKICMEMSLNHSL